MSARRYFASCMLVSLWLVPTVAGAQARPDPAETRRLVELQALLAVDASRAWRTDSWVEQGEVVLRLTPSEPSKELSRARPKRAGGIEARARYAPDGGLQQLAVQNLDRPGLLVARGAPSAARTAALASARFGARADAALLAAARARRWTALGGEAMLAQGATLAWRPVAEGRERALWQVRATVVRNGQPIAYLLSLDPADGSLVEAVREGVQR